VGLKDALATLERRGVLVEIRSKHADLRLVRRAKHGFGDLVTLHVEVRPPADPQFQGTEFRLDNLADSDVAEAKRYFLRFSDEVVLEKLDRGQILSKPANGPARIYVRGLRVAEESGFAMSYDITQLTKTMARALNRERANVGRTVYSDQVKAILLGARTEPVARKLAEQLGRLDQGDACDEIQWIDVQEHACKILNAIRSVVFVDSQERTTQASAVDEALSQGFEVVTIPSGLRARLEDRNVVDQAGQPVRHLSQFLEERAAQFEYRWVEPEQLTSRERTVWDTRRSIIELAGGLPHRVQEIRISETICPTVRQFDTIGVWEPAERRIVVRRDQLRSVAAFAGTLLHEVAHARSGAADVSRRFEDALTRLLGHVVEASLLSE
jgi:hypothetical protein